MNHCSETHLLSNAQFSDQENQTRISERQTITEGNQEEGNYREKGG